MQLGDILAFLNSKEIGYEYVGDQNAELVQVADIGKATNTQITFFNDPKRKLQLNETKAGLVVLKAEFSALTSCNKLIVANPYYVYAHLAQLFNPIPFSAGVHPTAVIDTTVELPQNCAIGAQVVIDARVKLAEGVNIGSGCFIGSDVTIGENTYLAPNVSIMHDCHIGHNVMLHSGCVIGGEGFGWAPNAGTWARIPQIGRVIIGNYVSIGNNSAIDRGALQDTVIEDHCIIDNLVHIAHNVTIGQGTAVAAQTGFAGSTRVGKQSIFAGQVGVAGHLELVDGVILMAKAGVTHSLKTPGSYSGFPAIPTAEWQKNTVRSKNLDKMAQKIKQLEHELQIIKNQLEE